MRVFSLGSSSRSSAAMLPPSDSNASAVQEARWASGGARTAGCAALPLGCACGALKPSSGTAIATVAAESVSSAPALSGEFLVLSTNEETYASLWLNSILPKTLTPLPSAEGQSPQCFTCASKHVRLVKLHV